MFVSFCLLPHLSITVRAGDGWRISDIIPGMGHVMLFPRCFHGMGHALHAAVMFSIITWCVGYVCSLCYECLLHTPSSCVCAQESALEVRSAWYDTYDDDALALSMHVLVTA